MLSFENSIRTIVGQTASGIGEYFDDFLKMSAKAAASTVLALAEILPKIVNSGPTETE